MARPLQEDVQMRSNLKDLVSEVNLLERDADGNTDLNIRIIPKLLLSSLLLHS